MKKNRTNKPSELTRWISCLLLFSLSACGHSSTIDLQKPATVSPPAESSKTNQPVNPDDTSQNPEKPDPPVVVGPVPLRYRLICESQEAIAPFSTLETTAKSFEGSFILFLGSYSDPKEVVTRDHKNIFRGAAPVAVPGALGFELDFLFIGVKQISNGVSGDLRLYLSKTDSVYRVGRVTDLGPSIVLDRDLRQAAESAGLAAANYGSSDGGRYLLLPSSEGYRVVSRDQSHTFGLIKADVRTTILPKIYENSKVFTALKFNGRGFTPILQRLSIESSGESSGLAVSSTVGLGSGESASVLQTFDADSFVWSETAPAGSNAIVIAKYDLRANRLTRAAYRSPVPHAKIYPQMAALYENADADSLVDEGNKSAGAAEMIHTLNVAVEAVTPSASIDNPGAVVTYAKIQKLILSPSGTSLKENGSLDYPATSIAKVRSSGMTGTWIIKSLFTTENSDELLATFDAPNGYQIYKDRGGFFDGVSENDCGHPSVVQEHL